MHIMRCNYNYNTLHIKQNIWGDNRCILWLDYHQLFKRLDQVCLQVSCFFFSFFFIFATKKKQLTAEFTLHLLSFH